MRIVCVGGGPAGLYFSISAKLRDAGHEIVVIERDPPEATYGWGVVYWNDLLDILHRNDPESARAVSAHSVLWQDQEIRVHGSRHDGTAYFGGYGYSLGRAALLDILTRRARSLGVDVRHETLADPADLPDADLIVACDGAGSRIRQSRAEHFGTRIETGRNPYIWLGTDRQFDSFVFDFEETPALLDLVPRLSVVPRDQHLHRGVLAPDLARPRPRHARLRGRRPAAGEDLPPGARRPLPDQPVTRRAA